VGRLMDLCKQENITMIITADHGNSDQMVYENGDMHTSHTEAPVPFVVFDSKLKDIKLELSEINLALKDVAPTILNIMGITQAPNFEGVSIFK
jgi:2,3-bisphosphoglycerate-independent phosphoglycerate mutase